MTRFNFSVSNFNFSQLDWQQYLPSKEAAKEGLKSWKFWVPLTILGLGIFINSVRKSRIKKNIKCLTAYRKEFEEALRNPEETENSLNEKLKKLKKLEKLTGKSLLSEGVHYIKYAILSKNLKNVQFVLENFKLQTGEEHALNDYELHEILGDMIPHITPKILDHLLNRFEDQVLKAVGGYIVHTAAKRKSGAALLKLFIAKGVKFEDLEVGNVTNRDTVAGRLGSEGNLDGFKRLLEAGMKARASYKSFNGSIEQTKEWMFFKRFLGALVGDNISLATSKFPGFIQLCMEQKVPLRDFYASETYQYADFSKLSEAQLAYLLEELTSTSGFKVENLNTQLENCAHGKELALARLLIKAGVKREVLQKNYLEFYEQLAPAKKSTSSSKNAKNDVSSSKKKTTSKKITKVQKKVVSEQKKQQTKPKQKQNSQRVRHDKKTTTQTKKVVITIQDQQRDKPRLLRPGKSETKTSIKANIAGRIDPKKSLKENLKTVVGNAMDSHTREFKGTNNSVLNAKL